MQAVNETHRTGLFSRDVWLRILANVGFAAEAVAEQTSEARMPRELFVGHRPHPRRAAEPGQNEDPPSAGNLRNERTALP